MRRISARVSALSPLVVSHSARSARPTATGSDGSRAALGERVSPSPGPAHRPDPLDKKSRSTVNSPIFA